MKQSELRLHSAQQKLRDLTINIRYRCSKLIFPIPHIHVFFVSLLPLSYFSINHPFPQLLSPPSPFFSSSLSSFPSPLLILPLRLFLRLQPPLSCCSLSFLFSSFSVSSSFTSSSSLSLSISSLPLFLFFSIFLFLPFLPFAVLLLGSQRTFYIKTFISFSLLKEISCIVASCLFCLQCDVLIINV